MVVQRIDGVVECLSQSLLWFFRITFSSILGIYYKFENLYSNENLNIEYFKLPLFLFLVSGCMTYTIFLTLYMGTYYNRQTTKNQN